MIFFILGTQFKLFFVQIWKTGSYDTYAVFEIFDFSERKINLFYPPTSPLFGNTGLTSGGV